RQSSYLLAGATILGAPVRRVSDKLPAMPAARPRRPSAPRSLASLLDEAFGAARAPVNGAVPSTLLEKRRGRARERLKEALKASRAKASEELSAKMSGLVQRWAERGFEDGFEEAEQFELKCFKAEEAGDADLLFAAMEKKHRAAVVGEY